MRSGTLRVILGPMFSRKTGELLATLSEEQAAGRAVQLFVIDPALAGPSGVLAEHRSRGGQRAKALRVGSAAAIQANLRQGMQTVGVDDAHFADGPIVLLVEEMMRAGINVHVAGLDLDFSGVPFSNVLLGLVAIADGVEKRQARCAVCGEAATRTARLEERAVVVSGPRIDPGGAERYEARCRQCFELRLVAGRSFSRSASPAIAGKDGSDGRERTA